jgi:hypothetical protein
MRYYNYEPGWQHGEWAAHQKRIDIATEAWKERGNTGNLNSDWMSLFECEQLTPFQLKQAIQHRKGQLVDGARRMMNDIEALPFHDASVKDEAVHHAGYLLDHLVSELEHQKEENDVEYVKTAQEQQEQMQKHVKMAMDELKELGS